MALINGGVPSMIQGVSQQPIQTRLPSQAEEQVNGISALMDGLGKRPPSQYVARIRTGAYTRPYVHFINRDAVEQYIVLVYPNGIEVYGRDGTSYPVVPADGLDFAYLVAKNPPDRVFKAMTLSDTTFLLHRGRNVRMTDDLTATRTNESIVWVRAGTYDTDYTIKVGSYGATVTTSATVADTSNIASDLMDLLVANTTGYSYQRRSNTIWIKKDDSSDFSITIADGNGGHNMSLVKAEVARFSDLPDTAPNGYVAKVAGAAEENADDYWVKFRTNTGVDFGPGIWEECPKPGVKYKIDPSTMPHRLVRTEDTDGSVTGTVGGIYFLWDEVTWGEKLAGDTNLEFPSFINKSLADIFLHRGRMGFLAQASCVLSQAGNLTNFWRQTALSLLDDDVIDVQVAHHRAVNLRHAVGFNEELLLFSDRTQFTLKGADILSPRTVSVPVASDYASHIDCVPTNAANMVYFPFDNGDYTGVREYFIDPATNQKDAKTVTDHVPRYVKGSALRMVVSPTDDTMFVLTDEDRNVAYVYQWYWNGTDKVQAAWHRWDFGTNVTVIALGYLDDDLFLVSAYGDGTYIEKIDMAPNAADANQAFPTMLDRRISEATTGVTTSYDAASDQTTISFPYYLDPAEDWVAVSRGTGDSAWIPGRRLPLLSINANRMVVDGDITEGFFAGRVYALTYQFSPAYLRSQSPLGGIAAVQEGRLQVLDWTVSFARTGYFRAEVTPDNRDTAVYPMTSQQLLVPKPGTGLGDVQLRDGKFRFKVLSRNDQVSVTLVNDSHLPSYFSGAEWVAEYTPKARRI